MGPRFRGDERNLNRHPETVSLLFDRRVFALVFALADYGRPICRAVVIGLGTVTAAGVMAGAVTVTAAWIIAVVFATNPNLKPRTPVALETAALTKPYSRLAGAANLSGLAGISVEFAGDCPGCDATPSLPSPASGGG